MKKALVRSSARDGERSALAFAASEPGRVVASLMRRPMMTTTTARLSTLTESRSLWLDDESPRRLRLPSGPVPVESRLVLRR